MLKVRYAARVFLINADKILLQKICPSMAAMGPDGMVRDPYWITPGGGVQEGETPEQAARRELFEETGITDAYFVVPHVWYSEIELLYKGEPTLFKEYYFSARVAQSVVSQQHYTLKEKKMILTHRWWSLDELRLTAETFFPSNLITLVEPSITH